MKKFENVSIEVISFSMTDIISTSLAGDKPGHGEDDEIIY